MTCQISPFSIAERENPLHMIQHARLRPEVQSHRIPHHLVGDTVCKVDALDRGICLWIQSRVTPEEWEKIVAEAEQAEELESDLPDFMGVHHPC